MWNLRAKVARRNFILQIENGSCCRLLRGHLPASIPVVDEGILKQVFNTVTPGVLREAPLEKR